MSLPRQFRRLRIGLIGFGDVARRILENRTSPIPSGHGPRWIAVSRSAAARGATHLHWDLDSPLTSKRVAATLTHCIMLAPPMETGRQDPRAKRLAVALRQQQRPLPCVYISTTGVYGDTQGGVVVETSPCHPIQARSQRRWHAEQSLREHAHAHVLRVPGIYGHDRLPIARLQARQPALRAEDDVFTNHIHADDLARIAFVALFRGRPKRVTNAVDESEMKMADYFDAVATALGLPKAPRITRDEMQALGTAGAIHPMMLSFLSESRRVRTARLTPELGIRLRYPTVADTLHDLINPSGTDTPSQG